MGAARKSARLLELTGGYKTHPERRNKQEPKIESLTLGHVPKHLTDYERECFIELMGTMPEGVYTKAEVNMLEIAAKLTAQSRLEWADFPAAKLGQLIKTLALLGLTPGERTKLVQPNKPSGNKFDG